MFNFVYIMRDYTGYSDAFCAERKRTIRYKKNELLSAFMMKVASRISESFDDNIPLSSWCIECNYKPIAYLDFLGKDKYICNLVCRDVRVSDLEINYLYCRLLDIRDARKIA